MIEKLKYLVIFFIDKQLYLTSDNYMNLIVNFSFALNLLFYQLENIQSKTIFISVPGDCMI